MRNKTFRKFLQTFIDNTTLNPGAGGDTIVTEQPGGVGPKICVTKIRIGALDVDGGDVTPTNPFPTFIADGAAAGIKASVGAFHNTDNQTLPAVGGSLLTGGVGQLTNPTGTADRARGTGVDGTAAVGIVAGSTQYAQKVKTTVAAAIAAAGTVVCTPASMAGIGVGSILTYDFGGANSEVVNVTVVTATTFTAVFAKSHPINSILTTFLYNQGRDAKGELDGADGIGTSVAAEYEFNGGSPGGGFFDRARSLQGKGMGSSTLNGNTFAGATSIVLAAVVGLQPGMPMYFNAAGGLAGTVPQEVAYVDYNYVPGTLTVPLQSALINAHTTGDTVRWGIYAAAGPGLNGFYCEGVGIEEEALFDPITGQFFLERAATTDLCAPQNVVLECPGLWNGASIDRGRCQSSANTTTALAGALTGVELTDTPAGWAVANTAAAAGTATCNRPAVALQRHVCTGISVSLGAGVAAQGPITAQLLDGATVLWAGTLAAAANGSAAIGPPGRWVGSVNTQMTLAFLAGAAANTIESVSMTGYDVG